MIKVLLNDQCCKFSGVINFATVIQVRKEGTQLIEQRDDIEFDFSDVTQGDSSAIALMLNWTRLAKSLKKSIKFVNLPSQLLDIASVCGVLSLLKIEPTPQDVG